MTTQRIRDEKAERELTRRLLDDVRNLSPFCRTHHGQHGTLAHEFELAQVPASAFAFAGELGPEWSERLRRNYEGR